MNAWTKVLAASIDNERAIIRICRSWKYAARQTAATWLDIVSQLSTTTPRSRRGHVDDVDWGGQNWHRVNGDSVHLVLCRNTVLLCCRNCSKFMRNSRNLRRLNLLALKANSWAVRRCRFLMTSMNFTRSSRLWLTIRLIPRMSWVSNLI